MLEGNCPKKIPKKIFFHVKHPTFTNTYIYIRCSIVRPTEQWLILQGTPLKTTVASWFNQLNYQNRMILFQQGLQNRDVDHESYLAFLTVVDHDIGDNPTGVHLIHIRGIQEIIGEFVRGISKTRSLWYHIVQQGPGDESDDDSDNEGDDNGSDDDGDDEEQDEH